MQTEDENQPKELQRSMKSRHLFMLSLGGVIGTGLSWDQDMQSVKLDPQERLLPIWSVVY